MRLGQRVAITGMLVSGGLAAAKIIAGFLGNSMATLADGLESASDVFASGIVLLGLTLAAKPPDEDHPYGHGRVEILAGLFIGFTLAVAGVLISYESLQRLNEPHEAIASFVIWPLLASFAVKGGLSAFKFHHAGKLHSDALAADAWNDAVDTISAVVALVGVGLALWQPARFLDADRWGGFIVGLIVIVVGFRVAYQTARQLMDTMPDPRLMDEVREVAASVPGALGVEKCFARKTGLRYHVDLHLEVDPEMTVRESHQVAHEVKQRIRERLDWVADVLVHVEPNPGQHAVPVEVRRIR